MDHVIPRWRGGGDEPANLRVVCGSYNSSRGAMGSDMIDYKSEMRIPQPEVRPKAEAQQPTPPPRMRIVRVKQKRPKAEQ